MRFNPKNSKPPQQAVSIFDNTDKVPIGRLLHGLNRQRLSILDLGSILRKTYKVERFILSSERGNQYLVRWNDDCGVRVCWECGCQDNIVTDLKCKSCSAELKNQKFVLSEKSRINSALYQKYQELGLCHPGLARLFEVFAENNRVYLVSEHVQHGFLSDFSSPLPIETIAKLCLSGCDTLAYLHQNGIKLATLSKEQLLVNEFNLIFHDLELDIVQSEEIPMPHRMINIMWLVKILREFLPPEQDVIKSLFDAILCAEEADEQEFRRCLKEVIKNRTNFDKTQENIAGMTNVGICRSLNEDCWGWDHVFDDLRIYAVADGMGGHDKGEVASELAIWGFLSRLRQRFEALPESIEIDALLPGIQEAFQHANNRVKHMAEKNRSDMGTTLVTAILYENKHLFVANVGDSRAYLIRDNAIHQLTQDHSLVASLVAMGRLSKDAMRHHPHGNILTRTVGKDWNVTVDTIQHTLKEGDVFLLCSDGLWNEVEESEILKIVQSIPNIRVSCQALVQSANRHGGKDNISVILVRI